MAIISDTVGVMKTRRRLAVCLLILSLLAPVAAAAWWVTWPDRTARAYADLVCQGRLEDANRLMLQFQWARGLNRDFRLQFPLRFLEGSAEEWRSKFRSGKWRPRSWSDVLAGKRRFGVCYSMRSNAAYLHTVRRLLEMTKLKLECRPRITGAA
jgi:hypothetical protein